MKKWYILLFILIVIPTLFIGAKNIWRGETMSASAVCEKWGEAAFNLNAFKNANNVSQRAKMACSLLKHQGEYIGKDRVEIRKLFGDHDGFYFSDMYPAYMIEVGKSRKQDSWQIVFILNRKEAVSEIVVHKNCCDS